MKASQALESHERALLALTPVTAHHSTASKSELSYFLYFWVSMGHVVSLPATTYQLSSPYILLGSWSNLFVLYTYVYICNILFFSHILCMYIFHLSHSFCPNPICWSSRGLILPSFFHWLLAQGKFFPVCCNFRLHEFKASFFVLAFAFQPKTLAFWDPQHLPALAVIVPVHAWWFGFRFHFCFLVAGDFPYFLVNWVTCLKEYLSFTQKFQMFL